MKSKIVLAFVMLLGTSVFYGIDSDAAPKRTDIQVIMEGKRLAFPDARPFMDENDRTLVPVRFVAENLGAKVGWHEQLNRVDIALDGKYISLTIGEKKAFLNGNDVVFDTAAVIKDNRTFVPLRFVSEALGETVEWDGFSRYVYVGEKVFLTPEELGIEPVSIEPFVHMYPDMIDCPTCEPRINWYLTDGSEPAEQVYIIKEEHLPLSVGDRIVYDFWKESSNRIGGRFDDDAMGIYYISDDGFGPRPRNRIESASQTLDDKTSVQFYPIVGAGDQTFLKDPKFDKYNMQIPDYIGLWASYKPKTIILLENPFQ